MFIETRFEYDMTERMVRALEDIAHELHKMNWYKENQEEINKAMSLYETFMGDLVYPEDACTTFSNLISHAGFTPKETVAEMRERGFEDKDIFKALEDNGYVYDEITD